MRLQTDGAHAARFKDIREAAATPIRCRDGKTAMQFLGARFRIKMKEIIGTTALSNGVVECPCGNKQDVSHMRLVGLFVYFHTNNTINDIQNQMCS